MNTALTIAGSDSIAGAGIQADIKTMMANGVYGMSAITALTAQNTTGISDVLVVDKGFLEAQIDAVFTDIVPDAVKTGMIPSLELMDAIIDRLDYYKAKNIVVDPVMVSTSGRSLMDEPVINRLKSGLFPIASLITPNIPEAQVLVGDSLVIDDKTAMEEAAKRLSDEYGCGVLIKGGHAKWAADDVLAHKGQIHWFHASRIDNPNNHGTGCSLSSAIAANLAKGYPVIDSVQRAKDYLSAILGRMLNLGKGNGPMDHGVDFKDI